MAKYSREEKKAKVASSTKLPLWANKTQSSWEILGGGVEYLAMNEEAGIFIYQLPNYRWLRALLGALAAPPGLTAEIVHVPDRRKKMFLGKL